MMNPAILSELDERQLRALILELTGEYACRYHGPAPFVPGKSQVPVSGKVYGASDLQMLVDASLDFWLTAGRYNAAFEEKLAERLGARFALTTNSGSSANLLALSALTSKRYMRDRALNEGDEVITVASGFPTTVNPILQYGMVPVFVDVDIPTYNIKPDMIEAAVTPKTRAIMIAHTLGNPFNLGEVMRVAKAYDLMVVEDCCDALGAKYHGKSVGTFGDAGTLSFYPAHQITMGEGGAVFTDKPNLARALESMRDWGRDCYCAPGQDNTCNKRFGHKLGALPKGYDHKYTYTHAGYNLKITDMQAAVGLAQLERLDGFIFARQRNFDWLRERFLPLEDLFILPEATPDAEPSWFGFPITIRESAKIHREDLLKFLEYHKIGTRLLFGGNLVRQPYMAGRNYRVVGELANADRITRDCFWLGLYPGLGEQHLDYTVETVTRFVSGLKSR